jgi:hypothetical protein
MINGKTPLIHVGYPKALSSWLQKLFFVPDNGFYKVLDPLTVQLFLIDAAPFSFTTDKCHEWIEKQIRETENADELIPVITSESLVGHTHCGGYNAKTNADRLVQVCPEGKILIIVREQKAEIRSLYKTFVIWGMPHSIKRILDPVDANLSPQFNLDFLRYDGLVAYYQQLYGKENVLVLPYEQFSRNSNEFLSSVYTFSGAEDFQDRLAKLPVSRKINTNQTLANLQLQRLKNYFLLSGPFNYSGLFTSTETRLNQRIARSKRNPLPSFTDNWFEDGFRDTVEKYCQGEFAGSNARLAEISGLDLQQYGYEL